LNFYLDFSKHIVQKGVDQSEREYAFNLDHRVLRWRIFLRVRTDLRSRTMNRATTLVVSRASKMAAVLGFAFLPGLSGCSRIQVGLGLRVSLAKVPVTSMEASLPKDPGVAPGEKSPLVVTFAASDGKTYVTAGKGKGKVQWKDLAIAATVVSINKKGVVTLNRDPRISDGKMGHLAITVPTHPGLSTELDVPVRYDYPFVSNFSGAGGSAGFNGTDGISGTNGSMGSIDPNNPSPGGDGTNGTNGSDGQDGDPGGDGPPVQVRVTLRAGTHPLLQIGVTTPGHKERFYLVDPQGGSLTVRSEGGPGAPGGRGGQGGRGGSGGTGSPNGNNGSDGSNGRNGNDGTPGRDGSITVTYDPQAQPFLASIRVPNQGGPKPIFTEAPVAPLW
jgi:hypothetical protein